MFFISLVLFVVFLMFCCFSLSVFLSCFGFLFASIFPLDSCFCSIFLRIYSCFSERFWHCSLFLSIFSYRTPLFCKDPCLLSSFDLSLAFILYSSQNLYHFVARFCFCFLFFLLLLCILTIWGWGGPRDPQRLLFCLSSLFALP